MKQYARLFMLLTFLLLSGCSLVPGQVTKPKTPVVTDVTGLPKASIEKGSIWRSGDGGKTFEPKSLLDDGKTVIETADVLSLTFHPQNSQIVYASTIANGILRSDNGGGTWKPIVFPPQQIQSFILDRRYPDTNMLATGVWGGIGKIFKTEDAGANWREVYSEPGSKTVVSALVQHARNTNVILAGTSDGTLIKSTDGGETWANIGQTINGTIADIGFDAVKPLSMYVLAGGKISSSEDGGKTWVDWEKIKQDELTNLRMKLSKARQKRATASIKSLEKQSDALDKRIRDERMPNGALTILPSPFVSGTIFASNEGGLYKSTDFGKFWKPLNIIESAKKYPIRALTASYTNQNEISFVADQGFYKSLNNGETWFVTQLRADRPISTMAYDPHDSNVLLIGLRKLK